MKPGDVIRQRHQRDAAHRVILAMTPNSCAVVIEGVSPKIGLPYDEVKVVMTQFHDLIKEGDAAAASVAKRQMQHPDVQSKLWKWMFGQYV